MRRISLAIAILAASAASAAAALSPNELTSQEQALYASIKSDPSAARNFLVTREYVRQAATAVKNPASASSFPDKPQGFSVRYLLPGDKETVNQAVALSVAAMAKSLWS